VLLGIPLARAVIGESAVSVAAFTTVGVVLTYNVLSVVVLLARGKDSSKLKISSILRGAVKNPLIIGAVLGAPFMLFRITLPNVILQPLDLLSQIGMPLGLLSVGGILKLSDATARLKPALYSSAIKVLILPLLAVTLTALLGYREAELLIILIITAAPAAVSSYAMASSLGGDGPAASNILIITTFFSVLSLSFGIYLLNTFGLI
jgi:predicted permease